MSILDAAKKLAAAGYTPVPLHGKQPRLSGWQNLRNVTSAQIDEWDSKGILQNVGVLCGEASQNLVVLDFDGMGGYEAFIERFPAILTYTVATGSGNGMHVYLKVAGELPTSTGQLNIPGGHIEIKSNGRQVVAPPSTHPNTGKEYTVVENAQTSTRAMQVATIREITDWIAEFNPKPTAPALPAPTPQAVAKGDQAEAYARVALERESENLARMGQGGRNAALNTAAMKLGQLVAAGALNREEVYRALYDACGSNGLLNEDGLKSFEATFNSGFAAGENQPRTIPTRHYALPGAPAYMPSKIVVEDNGVLQIGRTRIIKRKSVLGDVLKRVDDDDYIPDYPPIRWPLKCMHFLKGNAEVTHVGKLVGMIGSSGSGKTSVLETLADLFVADKTSVALWSPEWTPDELAERAVQRHGGVQQVDLYKHEIYKHRAAHGENVEQMWRDKLPDKAGQDTALAIRTMNGWDKDVYFMENAMMTVDEMKEVVAAMRESMGEEFPRVLICDYMQLLKANSDGNNETMHKAVSDFKTMCIHNQILGIVASQTTKEETRANINGGKFKGTTVLNVAKNSMGIKGKVRVKSDPERLRIIDAPYPDQLFSDKAYYLGTQSAHWINDFVFNLWVTVNPEFEEDGGL